MQMPTGIGILAALHGFVAIFLLVHVIISIPIIIITFFSDAGLGALATLDTIWDWIMIGVHGAIAGALAGGRSWGRSLILVLSIIGLVFGVINFFSGNMFAIFSIIINGIVISYLRKPHVKQWFGVVSV